MATSDGECFVLDHVYRLDYQHGDDRLVDLLQFSPAAAAPFVQDARLAAHDFRDFLFLDTETTGLAGAGTLAFMVGVGFFEPSPHGERFVVRQYFLRDHGDEPALLLLLDELLAEKAGLVTFNGRSFDVPLLEGRFIMNRMPTDLRDRPHLDLLHPARRLWRHRLGSCALGSLEGSLLGLRRTFPPRTLRLMVWGGLRGGISVALALSLPSGPERDLLLTVTYCVVVFSILVQGLTVGKLVASESADGR